MTSNPAGRLPTGQLRRFVQYQARPYSIDRLVGRDETAPGAPQEYDHDAHTVDLYVYESSGGESNATMGPVQQGRMRAVGDGTVDLRVADRLDVGTRTYEVVEPIRYLPDPGNPVIAQFSLERVADQNTGYVESP